jgi:hypothetical protein
MAHCDCQSGYGALASAKRGVARMKRYVERQKEYHREGTLWQRTKR